MGRGLRRELTLGLALSAVLITFGSPAMSWHPSGTCTLNFVGGNDQSNVLYGTFTCDHMEGYGGNDLIFAYQERDGVHGGSGADTIYGHENNDTLHGQSGADYIDGGSGTDTCVHGGDPGDQKVNCEA